MVHATGRASWRRSGALAAVVLAIGLVAAACGGGSSSESGQSNSGSDSGAAPPSTAEPDAGPPQPGGKLAYALTAETSGWNPASGQWAASGHQVAMAIYDRLGAWDTNYEVKPFLAESITPNADFTEWTLGVREGVTFHNGDPVDAEAIATNLEAFKNAPLTQSALAPIESIEPSADGTAVVVKMNRPFSTYPLQLTSQVGVVAWPGMYDPANADATRNPIGSGPFKFQSWDQNNKLEVTKNDDYWREGLPYLDEIEFSIVTDSQARQAALQTGTVDMAEFFDIESINQFVDATSEEDFRVLSDPNGEAEEALIMLNTDKAPFDNPKARLALAKGLDKDSLLQVVGDGDLVRADGPYQPSSPWYAEGIDTPTYDVEEAKRLVQEVKDEGDGTFAFTLTGIPAIEVQRMVQLLQQQWEPLGIDVTLEDTEQTTLINRAVTGDFQAVTWRQFGATIPDGEYVWTTCENIKEAGQLSLNFARNCDEELDKAMNDARATDDKEQQKAAYKIFQERLNEDLPYLWMYESPAVIIASTKVHDITKATLPDGQPQLSMVSVVHPVSQIWISQ